MVMFVHALVWAWLSLLVVGSMEQGSELVVVEAKMGVPWPVELVGIDSVGAAELAMGIMVECGWCCGSWLGRMVGTLPISIDCRGLSLSSSSP